jgi:PPOX class probable F420-dependent enzyme
VASDAAPSPSRALRGAEILDDPLVAALLSARLVCVLATLEPDGSVHAVPMWFAAAGDAVVLTTGSRSRKRANLERDPRATVVLHDSRPGFEVCGASIRGAAQVVVGDPALELVRLVHDRYVTAAGQRLAAPASYLASDDVAILVRPEHAVVWDERSSDAAEALRRAGGGLPLEPVTPRP